MDTYLWILPLELREEIQRYDVGTVQFHANVQPSGLFLTNLTFVEPGKKMITIPKLDFTLDSVFTLSLGVSSLDTEVKLILSSGAKLRVIHREIYEIYSNYILETFRAKLARVALELIPGNYDWYDIPRLKMYIYYNECLLKEFMGRLG